MFNNQFVFIHFGFGLLCTVMTYEVMNNVIYKIHWSVRVWPPSKAHAFSLSYLLAPDSSTLIVYTDTTITNETGNM